MSRIPLASILLLAVAGCGREYRDETPTQAPPPATPPGPAATLPTGAVVGRVTWAGEIPTVPPINGLVRDRDGSKWANVPNHFAPRIDPTSKAIAGAVVWLSGIEPAKSKPWPYPPLTVEVREFRLRAVQGEQANHVGFVRVGDDVELKSVDVEFQMIRARGAAFFTVPFSTANAVARRKIDRTGHVEFTSGAGYFWSAADVFACEHPYFAVTDSEGKVRFDHVPPGEYEAVGWLRNWAMTGTDRDPETGRTMRLIFADPFTVRGRVTVPNGGTAAVELWFSNPAQTK